MSTVPKMADQNGLSHPTNLTSDDNNVTSTMTTTPPYYYHGVEVVATMNFILAVTMVLAISGNIMVIMTILRRKSMRTRTNMFIINLAIADILVAVFDMPVSMITLAQGEWVFGDAFCEFNGVTMSLFLVASIHTLMYISVHKYISITRPFSRFMTPPRILIMIAATWIWSSSYAIGAALGWNSSVYKTGASQCGPSVPDNPVKYSHSLTNTIFNFVIPLSVMLFCYIGIFREIRGHMARMRETTNLDANNSIAQQKRISVTLIMVVVCFLCCWTPYILYSTTLTAMKDRVPLIANAVAYWCGYLNSACNPIIYAFRSPSFRQGYWEIMCGRSEKFYSQGSFSQRSPSFRRRTLTHTTRQSTFRTDDFRNGSLDARPVPAGGNNRSSPWHQRIFSATISNGQFTAMFNKTPSKLNREDTLPEEKGSPDGKSGRHPRAIRTRSPTAITLLSPSTPDTAKSTPPAFPPSEAEQEHDPDLELPKETSSLTTSSRKANSDTDVFVGTMASEDASNFRCDSDEEMESWGRRRKLRRKQRSKTTLGMPMKDQVRPAVKKKRSRSTNEESTTDPQVTAAFLKPVCTVQKSNSWSHVNDKTLCSTSDNLEASSIGSTIKKSFRAIFGSLNDNRSTRRSPSIPTRRRSISDHEDDDDDDGNPDEDNAKDMTCDKC